MSTKTSRKRQRGIALAMVGVMLVALLAMLVVGIDLGRVAHTASEAQTVADTAAESGAWALSDGLDAQTEALSVAGRHVFDGTAADAARVNIELGNYDQLDGFTTGGDFPTAVRATATTTVDNIMAGIFGASAKTSTVSRVAIAAMCGQGNCDPAEEICFPLCLGDCHFQALQECSLSQPDCLPTLNLVPSGVDNAGWTAFFDVTSTSSIRDFLPAVCGGTDLPPEISVGDVINLQNGEINSVLQAIDQCLSQLQNLDLTIPICSCDGTQFNQPHQVVGFATIHITGVTLQGPGARGISIDTIVPDPGGGAPGTGCGDLRFGTPGGVKMVCDRDTNQCG